MLMEFSLDVNNCRTNWMRKQAGLLKYADGTPAPAQEAPAPAPAPEAPAPATTENPLGSYDSTDPIVRKYFEDLTYGAPETAEDKLSDVQKYYRKQMADAYTKAHDDKESAGMFNRMTGSLGGLGVGGLLALATPKKKRDVMSWLTSLGIGGGLGFVGGNYSEGVNRDIKGQEGAAAERAARYTDWYNKYKDSITRSADGTITMNNMQKIQALPIPTTETAPAAATPAK